MYEFDKKCRFCGSFRLDLWTSHPKNYLKCFDCNFISVELLPTADEIDDHYKYYHDNNHQAIKEKNELRIKSYQQEIQWLINYIDVSMFSKSNPLKVFDYGCSGGYFLDQLKNNIKPDYLLLNGYDKSDPAIEILKQKGYYIDYSDNKIKNKYNLIVIRGVIEHVVDFKSLFANLSKMLTKGGFLFITATPNGNSPCATVYRHNWVQHHYPSHLQHFSSVHFDIMSANSGLHRIDSVDFYHESPYKNNDDRKIFIEYLNTKDSNTTLNSNNINQQLRHAYHESMLTLLYRKGL